MCLKPVGDIVAEEGEVVVFHRLGGIETAGINQVYIQTHVQLFPEVGGEPGFELFLTGLLGSGTVIIES